MTSWLRRRWKWRHALSLCRTFSALAALLPRLKPLADCFALPERLSWLCLLPRPRRAFLPTLGQRVVFLADVHQQAYWFACSLFGQRCVRAWARRGEGHGQGGVKGKGWLGPAAKAG